MSWIWAATIAGQSTTAIVILFLAGSGHVIIMLCRFLKLMVRGLEGVSLVAGLDIDRGILEEESRFLAPLPTDWLNRRSNFLAVELYHSSCGDEVGAGVLAGRVQAVTSFELVEHLKPDTLASFPSTVLGKLRPMLWVVSTPNQEFNSLFR